MIKEELLAEALGAEKQEEPDSQVFSDEVPSDSLEPGSDADPIEETFGVGANKRVLLVTKGISLKKIVEASK
jgi:hypothetical protein